MIAYRYDDNGIFIAEMQCQIDPLETKKAGKDIFLIPANCTLIQPLESKEGFNVVWDGNKWEYAEIPQKQEIIERELTLEEVKQQKIMELKNTRDMKEIDVISYNGNTFDYDDKSRDRLSIARQSLEDAGAGEILWTTADNQSVTMTVEDFAGINTQAAIRSNALHVQYNQLRDNVLAAETKEEVNAIIWPENN